MKLINSSYQIIKQEPNLLGTYKQIELAARIAYKSEDKITEDSAERMVEALCKNDHGAALEHGTIYLKIPYRFPGKALHYQMNDYSKTTAVDGYYYITTNARVIFEHNWQEDLQFMCEPTEYHEKRISVKFICSIGVSREILRHRKFSFLNESTRFCNYSKNRFGNELTFIIPQWIYDVQREEASYRDSLTGESKDWLMGLSGEQLVNQLSCEDRHVSTWVDNLEKCESDYFYLMEPDEGYPLRPEQARGILPLDLKSELIVTGFISDWIHFFNLRSYIAKTGKPHPDIMVLTNDLMQEFMDLGYCTYDEIKNESSK